MAGLLSQEDPPDAALLREEVLDTVGAALDVLPQEPPDPDDPILGHPKVLLSPHAAFYSLDSDEELRRRLPRVGTEVSTPHGRGRVRKLDLLRESVTVDVPIRSTGGRTATVVVQGYVAPVEPPVVFDVDQVFRYVCIDSPASIRSRLVVQGNDGSAARQSASAGSPSMASPKRSRWNRECFVAY